MSKTLIGRLKRKCELWLAHEPPPTGLPLCDFERIRYEVRPCDVLLVEGRSHVSEVIKVITQSPWSHAALYIGRIHDIENPILREELMKHFDGEADTQLMIESILGKGTIVAPLDNYAKDHLRICRPRGIARSDSQKVIGHAIGRLGMDYDVRQILDLARFMFPWSIMPRRWRSSLFQHNIGSPTRIVCSSMLAESFACVKFPILPLIKKASGKGLEFIRRNPRLYTPSDFDYSPYFEIIKYPFIEIAEAGLYRDLPWNNELISNDENKFQEIESAFPEQAAIDEKSAQVEHQKSAQYIKTALLKYEEAQRKAKQVD